MTFSTPLSTRAATAYAELLETARGLELGRTVAAMSGSFASKRIRDRTYWYYQYRDVDDAVRQLYVGPDSPGVRALIDGARARERYDQLEPMARAAIELGCEPIAPTHFTIIRRLADYGFFRADGVLVGTNAFIGLAASLAVRWNESSRTEDVDFAHAGRRLTIALPTNLTLDVPNALESLALGFVPTSAFAPTGSDATYVSAKHGLRIDFLTTRTRSDEPVYIENLNVAMQPLPFMELLLEHPEQLALLSRAGAIVVNVPSPVRLALHKLIVAVERSTQWRAKSVKDLAQAAALLEAVARTDSEIIEREWNDAKRRGPQWKKKLQAGRKALLAMPGASAIADSINFAR